ncbi:MAG: ATP synthase A1 subunit C [Halobacteriota archaeon]
MDYEYIGARIRGMKSRLLERKELEALGAKMDINSFVDELENTPYRQDLEDASVKYIGLACVEDALRRNLSKTFRLILSFVKGEDAETLINIFLNKWDIQNIKTILRGKNIQEVPEEIAESLAPAGALSDATLTEMIKQPDVKAVIDLLATWGIEYSRPLTQHFKEFSETRDLVVLEYALDKFYYNHALDAVAGDSYDEGIIRGIVRTEIDVTNIKNVLRIIRDKVELEDPQYYFISGGKELNVDKLSALSKARTMDGVTKQLAGTSYAFLAQLPDQYITAEKISPFEKELDKFLLQKALSLFSGDPLSLALVIGYLWAKLNEITNIRIIAMCKSEYVPEKEVMEELVFV